MSTLGRATVAMAVVGLWVSAAQAWPWVTSEVRIARVERLLDEAEIDTATLGENLSLESSSRPSPPDCRKTPGSPSAPTGRPSGTTRPA